MAFWRKVSLSFSFAMTSFKFQMNIICQKVWYLGLSSFRNQFICSNSLWKWRLAFKRYFSFDDRILNNEITTYSNKNEITFTHLHSSYVCLVWLGINKRHFDISYQFSPKFLFTLTSPLSLQYCDRSKKKMTKNEITILFTGYSKVKDKAVILANCTCSMIRGKNSVTIVDTRTAWDGDEMIQGKQIK